MSVYVSFVKSEDTGLLLRNNGFNFCLGGMWSMTHNIKFLSKMSINVLKL